MDYEWAYKYKIRSILGIRGKKAALESRKLSQADKSFSFWKLEDILYFHVVLYGNFFDFAKDYHAVLLYKNKPIQPFTEQMMRIV